MDARTLMSNLGLFLESMACRWALYGAVPILVFVNFEWYDTTSRRRFLWIVSALLFVVAGYLYLTSGSSSFLKLLVPPVELVVLLVALIVFRGAAGRALENNLYSGWLTLDRFPDRIVCVLVFGIMLLFGAYVLDMANI